MTMAGPGADSARLGAKMEAETIAKGHPVLRDSFKKRFRVALPQILATSAKNMLLLCYGMTLGFPTIVIGVLQESANRTYTEGELVLSMSETSWFSSINLICVPLGCLLSGVVTNPIGRRPSMMIINLPFIAAWLMFYFADSVGELYAALALTGFAGGLLEAPVLTYVAEICQPKLRGVLSATSSMCVILGVFIQFLLGNWIHWRNITLVNLICPISAIVALFFVPESPHWLLTRGRVNDAERSLCWLRGWVKPDDVKQELDDLVSTLSTHGNKIPICKRPEWKHYTKKTFVKPYLLVSYAFFLGHFCGMTTLQTYAVVIFAGVGAPETSKFTATLILGIVQLLGSLVCVAQVHKLGKRPLVLMSTLGNGVFVIAAAAYTYYSDNETKTVAGMVLLLFAAFFTHSGIRLLPWILIGEVYPPNIRGTASGASGSIGYILGFATNKSFLYLQKQLTLPGILIVYGCISLIGCVSMFLVLPETEGRTLYEIEQYFASNTTCSIGGPSKQRHGYQHKPRKGAEDADRWAASNPALELNEHRAGP